VKTANMEQITNME